MYRQRGGDVWVSDDNIKPSFVGGFGVEGGGSEVTWTGFQLTNEAGSSR